MEASKTQNEQTVVDQNNLNNKYSNVELSHELAWVNNKGEDTQASEEDKGYGDQDVGAAQTQHKPESRESTANSTSEDETSKCAKRKYVAEGESDKDQSELCKPASDEVETDEEKLSEDSTVLHTLELVEDVSSKAFNTAKQLGSVLFSYGKAAGRTVVEQASKLKNAVEEKAQLGDFNQEQEMVAAVKKEHRKLEEDAVAPWVGYHEEEIMKKQILSLSTDRRNFLQRPPSDAQYEFDFATFYPVALATLREDANLRKMRFELVPKRTTEENFWNNYFYQVTQIKHAIQLRTMEQQEDGPWTPDMMSGVQSQPMTAEKETSLSTALDTNMTACVQANKNQKNTKVESGVTKFESKTYADRRGIASA